MTKCHYNMYYVYMCIFKHIQIHVCMYMYMYTFTYIYARVCVCVCVRVCLSFFVYEWVSG